ncbi:OLC1v1018749C1 [Oldenlandia corymbosa var. corymbosa]|uniref:OLC1v1018749C1 n=1 Tax=Oldenlandia corymbosa var. corymbosa TaxID=529605 RepID=A0AAV1ECF7_OLDCO|nr:OLC1v1018749C1 [Oldenlandia corymbosa var. corymbosa]
MLPHQIIGDVPMVVHMFNDPPFIECPLLEERARAMTEVECAMQVVPQSMAYMSSDNINCSQYLSMVAAEQSDDELYSTLEGPEGGDHEISNCHEGGRAREGCPRSYI